MTLADAARISRVEALEALRDRLAEEIDKCESARDIAALSNRFQDCLRELAEIAPEQTEKPLTDLDELRAKREARKTG